MFFVVCLQDLVYSPPWPCVILLLWLANVFISSFSSICIDSFIVLKCSSLGWLNFSSVDYLIDCISASFLILVANALSLYFKSSSIRLWHFDGLGDWPRFLYLQLQLTFLIYSLFLSFCEASWWSFRSSIIVEVMCWSVSKNVSKYICLSDYFPN